MKLGNSEQIEGASYEHKVLVKLYCKIETIKFNFPKIPCKALPLIWLLDIHIDDMKRVMPKKNETLESVFPKCLPEKNTDRNPVEGTFDGDAQKYQVVENWLRMTVKQSYFWMKQISSNYIQHQQAILQQ